MEGAAGASKRGLLGRAVRGTLARYCSPWGAAGTGGIRRYSVLAANRSYGVGNPGWNAVACSQASMRVVATTAIDEGAL